jgi:hypothetical protein
LVSKKQEKNRLAKNNIFCQKRASLGPGISKKDLKTNRNGTKTAFKGSNKLVFAKIISEKLILS